MAKAPAGQSAEVSVVGTFPTPVVRRMLDDARALNRELRKTIFDRRASQESTQHSNLGGWQSSWDLGEWGGAAAARVIDEARRLAGRMTCDRAGRPVETDWLVNAWANVNRGGDGNEFHTHPGAFWSATYYVDDGGAGADPSVGGEFEIQDPRGVAPAMLAPHLGFAMPGGQSAGASELIPPRNGMLLMFPSWLSHGVRPYRGSGVRISVAVNLTPAGGPA